MIRSLLATLLLLPAAMLHAQSAPVATLDCVNSRGTSLTAQLSYFDMSVPPSAARDASNPGLLTIHADPSAFVAYVNSFQTETKYGSCQLAQHGETLTLKGLLLKNVHLVSGDVTDSGAAVPTYVLAAFTYLVFVTPS